MAVDRDATDQEQEPIGIVISRGRSAEAPPRVAAYVWAEVEDATAREAEGVEVATA